ncbi:centrosomal protein 43 isoform X2 [Nematostella vectensis]|uniref:centrosomal protein 43 isoform X2 n=1 Tax=Nematostella vectensis TaxID=45351 RepID=UPI002077812D|nr:centrosomal protein 43 isoform X2 [Nematostella vectensis]
MSTDEDTELRDLVAQSLESKGVLGKIRNKIPLTNGNLKKFISTSEGRLVAGLVREFLEFFELDFTIAVFDPESNFSDKYQGRNNLANELNLPDSDSAATKPLLAEVVRHMKYAGSASNNGTTGAKPTHHMADSQPQVKNSAAFSSPRHNGPASPRSTSPSSGKGKDEDFTELMISAGFESDEEMKPSRIPQRIREDRSSKSDNSQASENGGDSFFEKSDLKSARSGSPDKTIGSDEDDIFAEFTRKTEKTKNSDVKKSDLDKKSQESGKQGGMLSSLRGAPPLSGGGLGSLKNAPPLPGTKAAKEPPKSPNWDDLAEIDSRINKLGFDIPGDEKSTHSQDYNDYDDDFQPTSSHLSDQSLSISEDIEEQLSSYRSNSNADDLMTTDRTVSRASDDGLDYAEDILNDF